MGGSDYDSDSSGGSAASYGSKGSKKKSKKDKKEKKDKGKDHKDKDKKDKKDKDHKDKDHDKKDKKDKDKHKDDKDKDKHKYSEGPSSSYSYGQHTASSTGPISVPAFNPNYPGATATAAAAGVSGYGAANFGTGYDNRAPSSATAPAPVISSQPPPSLPQPSLYPGQTPNMSQYQQDAPPSGYRTPLDSKGGKPFPTDFQEVGPPVTYDADGSPIYIGSVLFENAVHPCKIGPHLDPPAQVAYGGVEQGHNGRYDLLPFVPEEMEWVPASYGQIPRGRRPVEGGYEESGGKLYHALAPVNGVKVPGKTGEHLGGANVGFGGAEHNVQTGYEILCWRH